MAILNIVLYPDDPLTQKAAPVESFDAELERLSEDMLETMHAYEGVGLAAPQVGISRRMLVLQEPDSPPLCLVNPEIVESEGSEEGEEGCLSLPNLAANILRATRIRVKAFDPHGKPLDFEATDFLARVIQHENDHLDGIVFPQRLDIITRQAVLQEWAALREALLASPEKAETEHAS